MSQIFLPEGTSQEEIEKAVIEGVVERHLQEEARQKEQELQNKRNGIDWKLLPIMIDPSVLTSDQHLDALSKFPDSYGPIYVPRTLFVMLSRLRSGEIGIERVESLLRNFVSAGESVTLSSKWMNIESPRYAGYEAGKEDVAPESMYQGLPDDVIAILSEEYAFLRKSSSLFSKSQQSVQYLKRRVKVAVDAQNSLVDKKNRIFHQIRGPRWTVAILLGAGLLLAGQPWLAALLTFGQYTLLYFDP